MAKTKKQPKPHATKVAPKTDARATLREAISQLDFMSMVAGVSFPGEHPLEARVKALIEDPNTPANTLQLLADDYHNSLGPDDLGEMWMKDLGVTAEQLTAEGGGVDDSDDSIGDESADEDELQPADF